MHAVDMTYDFVIGSDRHRGHVTRSRSVSGGEGPPAFSGTHDHWNTDEVDVIELSHGAEAKIFWDAEIFGDRGDPEILMREERDVALILNCEGGVWIGRSEPTLDDRVGLAIYNERGKVLMTGIGDLVDDHSGKRRLQASLENPFSWRAASPKACAHVRPYIRPTPPPDGGTN